MEVKLQVEDRDDVEERPATRLTLRQTDPWDRGLLWNQRLQVLFGAPPGSDTATKGVAAVHMDRPQVRLEGVLDGNLGAYILANGQGIGYGYFQLTETTRGYLIGRLPEIEEPMTRAVAWLSLWDEMLEGNVAASAILDLIARWLEVEETSDASLKSTYLRAYGSIARSDEAVGKIRELWAGDLEIDGLTLSEPDFIGIAHGLAVREVEDWESILDTQAERIENPDRRARFEFVRPALSADPAVRDAFFESLGDLENRSHEPWVLEALSFLHHPLRAAHAERYILPSLELLEEIQTTGDIFFPKRWLDSTLGGHRSEAASLMVRDFLASRPDYPARLRGKILQSADMLFRAARLESARQEP
jgi:aminopeptidase N